MEPSDEGGRVGAECHRRCYNGLGTEAAAVACPFGVRQRGAVTMLFWSWCSYHALLEWGPNAPSLGLKK
eukprot:4087835-Pyramimonas_sp.AAC.1